LAVAITGWTWIPSVGLAGTFLLLLFPDGHLPSPRWRWFAWVVGVGMGVVALTVTLGSKTLADNGYPHVANPLFIEGIAPVVDVLFVSIAVIPIGILGSAWSWSCASEEPIRRNDSRSVGWPAPRPSLRSSSGPPWPCP
jgi:hypothetical protein